MNDYHRMIEAGILSNEDRVELLHGELIEKSPIGSQHGAYVKKLNKLLNRLLGDRVIVGVQDPVQIPLFSEPEPDIALLKPRSDFYADAHPKPGEVLLIIEVADTSLYKDREVKLPIYAAAGIPEYWIVNLAEEEIEMYRDPQDGSYRTKTVGRRGEVIRFYGLGMEIVVEEVLG